MTLEQKYHVKSEPANTCPIIDAASMGREEYIGKVVKIYKR